MQIINLMKKDLLVCKKYYIFSMIYIVTFGVIFNEFGMLLFIMCAVGINYLISNTSMAFDDKYKADIMMNILPVSRKDIVLVKYLNALVNIVYVLVLYYLAVFITSFSPIFGVEIVPIDLKTFLMCMLIICIYNSIEIPLYYKIGYQKTRFFGFIVFFAFFGVASLVVNNININQKLINFMSNSNDVIKWILLFLITILISYISYIISTNIYRKKDF